MNTFPTLSGAGVQPGISRPGPSAAAPKVLATMLLAAIVTALLVAADSLVETFADGHLLVGWLLLWAVAFAALALFADSARNGARRLHDALGELVRREAQRAADRNYLACAQHDPRIMAELMAAAARANEDAKARDLVHGRAWVNHRPRGTLNAAYPGPRSVYLTTPMVGLPVHLQYLPG